MPSPHAFPGQPNSTKALLTLALALAGYVSRRCFRSPNPRPPNPHRTDRLFRQLSRIHGPVVRELFFVVATALHIAALWLLPTATDSSSRLLCRHPEHVDPALFRFSPYVLACLALIAGAGAVRLAAFAALGPSFTFELAPPRKLVTHGVYRYVQHPSYPPDVLLTLTNLALLCNGDGVAGCALPRPVVEWYAAWKWGLFAAFFAVQVAVMSMRVADEEAMLRETFGEEWEAWHRKTARIIPGLF